MWLKFKILRKLKYRVLKFKLNVMKVVLLTQKLKKETNLRFKSEERRPCVLLHVGRYSY